jgi:hypothetical protein
MGAYDWLKNKYKRESKGDSRHGEKGNLGKKPEEYTYDDWMDAIAGEADPDVIWEMGDLIGESELLTEHEKFLLMQEIQRTVEERLKIR